MAIAWRPSYRKRELLKDLDDQEIERLWSGVDVKGYGLTERDAEWEHCRRTCGKEDISTPMTAPDTQPQDTQSAAALWWEALQVMGGEPSEWTGDRWTIEVGPVTLLWNKPLGLFSQWNAMAGQYGGIDHWDLFGLAVEWIEARGEWFVEICSTRVDRYDGPSQWHFVADTRPITSGWLSASADTLPTAAARWIVEHGPKIAKETTP